MTAPIYMPPPPGGRSFVIFLLVFLLGGAAGFGASQIVSHRTKPKVSDSALVLYENAAMSFPFAGAAFTASTFDQASKTCNRDLLKQYLRADPRRFKAWIDLEQVTAADFDAFVARLQSQILVKATPVTNHGCFPNGECPFAFQSVLGPGTSVWFDPQQNRIVAKCACSNPVDDPRCPPNCEDVAVVSPTEPPTPIPTEAPTPSATAEPTPSPTAIPTPTPTVFPSVSPTRSPVPTKT